MELENVTVEAANNTVEKKKTFSTKMDIKQKNKTKKMLPLKTGQDYEDRTLGPLAPKKYKFGQYT